MSMDNLYNEFCDQLEKEMENKLECRIIKMNHGLNNKRRHIRKPWWSEELSTCWNELCVAEKKWSNAVGVEKFRLKADMKAK